MEYIKFVICIICILIIFYFAHLSNVKQNKKLKEMQNKLQIGDKIITYSGLCGVITDVFEDRIILETNPNKVKLSVEKWAVAGIDDRTF